MAAATAVLALGAVACGREEPADLANGKKLFLGEGQCSACHALARANASSDVGPDLDAAFASARRAGMNEETIEGIVRSQIENPRVSSQMPADLVEGDAARDVAAYIAYAAGQAGEDTGALAKIGLKPAEPLTASGGALEIPADPTGGLAFVTGDARNPGKVELIRAEPGPLTLAMPNEAAIPHNVAVRDGGLDEKGEVVEKGGISRVSVELDAGSYTFYCSVPGHEQGGMVGKIEVR